MVQAIRLLVIGGINVVWLWSLKGARQVRPFWVGAVPTFGGKGAIGLLPQPGWAEGYLLRAGRQRFQWEGLSDVWAMYRHFLFEAMMNINRPFGDTRKADGENCIMYFRGQRRCSL